MQKKIVALLMTFVLIIGIVPATVLAGGESTAATVTVTFSAQKDGAFLIPRNKITVEDGLAEQYGYSDKIAKKDHLNAEIGGPTVFDALVAVHKAKYGDAFTAETAETYLKIEDGMLETAFKAPASATGFFVNGDFLNDGIVGTYGTTLYLIDAARLTNNDLVEFFFYQDSDYWSDCYTYFEKDEISAKTGDEITLSLKGFMAMSAMGYSPVPGAISGDGELITLNEVNTSNGSLGAALTDANGDTIYVNENGKAKISFSRAGTYIITANGFDANLGSPIIAPWCKITVTDDNTEESENTFFTSLDFSAEELADGEWTEGETFSSNVTEYDLQLKDYSVSSLTLKSSTSYNTDKYGTSAEYVNASGEIVYKEINSGAKTVFSDLAFGKTVIKITIWDNSDWSSVTYVFNVTRPRNVTGDETKAQMSNMSLSFGTSYPELKPDNYNYTVVVPAETIEMPVLTFKTSDGVKVKTGNDEAEADSDGLYKVNTGTTAVKITLTSADGSIENCYTLKTAKRSEYDTPDKVVDYLCIGSNYTNTAYGISPESTLYGSMKSLGNFGGYITYYYDTPIVNNPKNKFGIDFYVYGNNFSDGGSGAENGQVYVSEDGSKWYALAGSEHYEKTAHWDYTITYKKDKDGKSSWTDNMGNKMENPAKLWPQKSYYYMNNVADKNEYTYSGIVFDSDKETITGDGTSSTYTCKASFGYADYYANGTIGADVNPYVEKPINSNGFDLEWAVDDNGNPITVDGKEFHYIKIATASNIWAGSFGEKSTEITTVVRTTEQSEAVGATKAPEAVRITDGAETKKVVLSEDKQIYDVDIDDMKYVSIGVSGAEENANIYVNNQRISQDESAGGFKVTKENGPVSVRVIVQSGDKEPNIYLLKLKSSATQSDEVIENVKVNVGGNVKTLKTNDGKNYSLKVGSRISDISLSAIVGDGVSVKINGAEVCEKYSLEYGENLFTVKAEDANGKAYEIYVTVTREKASSGSGTAYDVKVYFTLYGDEKHGSDKTHTYKKKNGLSTWLSKTSVTVPSGSTVLDVIDKALKDANITYKNDGGNYISEVNGLKEFDNGVLSGWMYMLNKKYTNYGIAEQSVKNGDSIILHYTDDYTAESSSVSSGFISGSSSSSSSQKNDKAESSSDITKEENKEDTEANGTESIVFEDVGSSDWFKEAVLNMHKLNIMKGVSDKCFAPEEYATRAMFVTTLHRIEKEPSATGNIFFDVSESDYYCIPIMWAYENGIVFGTSETEFSPNENITREQIAVLLYRYGKYKGIASDEESSFDLSAYSDSDDISDYAKDAMQYACESGIFEGYEDGSLCPGQLATRAEIAVILTRYIELSVK